MSDTFSEYEKAVRSGRYKKADRPYIHPDSVFAKKEPDIQKSASFDLSGKVKKYWPVLLILLALFVTYKAYERPEDFRAKFLDLIELKSVESDFHDEPVISEPTARDLEKAKIQPVPDWEIQQRIAFEKLRVMERLANKALDQYYDAVKNNYAHPGLCITTGDRRRCYGASKVISPDLPPMH